MYSITGWRDVHCFSFVSTVTEKMLRRRFSRSMKQMNEGIIKMSLGQ